MGGGGGENLGGRGGRGREGGGGGGGEREERRDIGRRGERRGGGWRGHETQKPAHRHIYIRVHARRKRRREARDQRKRGRERGKMGEERGRGEGCTAALCSPFSSLASPRRRRRVRGEGREQAGGQTRWVWSGSTVCAGEVARQRRRTRASVLPGSSREFRVARPL